MSVNDPPCLPLCISPSPQSTYHSTGLVVVAAAAAAAAAVVLLVLLPFLQAWSMTLPGPAAGR
jgi:hypothetical protein